MSVTFDWAYDQFIVTKIVNGEQQTLTLPKEAYWNHAREVLERYLMALQTYNDAVTEAARVADNEGEAPLLLKKAESGSELFDNLEERYDAGVTLGVATTSVATAQGDLTLVATELLDTLVSEPIWMIQYGVATGGGSADYKLRRNPNGALEVKTYITGEELP